MKRFIFVLGGLLGAALLLAGHSNSHGRGFGARGGFRAGGGYRSYGGYRSGAVVGHYGGAAYGHRSYGTVVGPYGAGYSRGRAGGTAYTPRGGTIQYGAAGAGVRGPVGGAAGRYVGGVRVTTPGGQTYTRTGRGAGAVGPAGYGVGRRTTIGTTAGPAGAGVRISHGGMAIGPGGVATRQYRGGVAVGPYGAVAGRSGYWAGAGARGTYYVSGLNLRTQGAYVRRGFTHYNYFTPAWYARYPRAWRPFRWTVPLIWAYPTWGYLAGYLSYPTQPIYYDYGSTVVYQGDNVYLSGEPYATTAQYNQQATAIANAGVQAQPPPKEEWQPLGVFALAQGDEKTSYNIFQLAIDKEGTIRGNYYNALTDSNEPVYGSVDKKTQRAAWTVGKAKTPVYEAGIANLTRDETTALVHFGDGRSQQMMLVRIKQPEEEKKK